MSRTYLIEGLTPVERKVDCRNTRQLLREKNGGCRMCDNHSDDWGCLEYATWPLCIDKNKFKFKEPSND